MISSFWIKPKACIALAFGVANTAAAQCDRFTQSTMNIGAGPIAEWRSDYPSSSTVPRPDWGLISFETAPTAYMSAVLETVEPHFSISDDNRMVGLGDEPWWIAPWMDVTSSGGK